MDKKIEVKCCNCGNIMEMYLNVYLQLPEGCKIWCDRCAYRE